MAGGLSVFRSGLAPKGQLLFVTQCALILAVVSFPTYASVRLLDMGIATLLFITMGIGLYMVVGFCRLFDLGYAGFICVGAYVTGVATKAAVPFIIAMALSALVAAGAGVILGIPTLRLRGDYFAIVTFGFSEIVVLIARNWTRVTGGPYGLGGIPNPELWGVEISRFPAPGYFYLILGVTVLVYFGVKRLRATVLGVQMVAVGDDEVLCRLRGVDVTAIKVIAFALSAAVGGVAGSFWAVYYKFLSHLDFTLVLSVQVVALVVLVGRRQLVDVVLLGLLLGPLSEVLRTALRLIGAPESARVIVYGIILVGVTHLRSRGFLRE